MCKPARSDSRRLFVAQGCGRVDAERAIGWKNCGGGAYCSKQGHNGEESRCVESANRNDAAGEKTRHHERRGDAGGGSSKNQNGALTEKECEHSPASCAERHSNSNFGRTLHEQLCEQCVESRNGESEGGESEYAEYERGCTLRFEPDAKTFLSGFDLDER